MWDLGSIKKTLEEGRAVHEVVPLHGEMAAEECGSLWLARTLVGSGSWQAA